jgi:hypothetical protein
MARGLRTHRYHQDEGAGGRRERGRRERGTTLSLETSGQRVDSVHLAERLCSFLSTFSSSTHRAFHGESAGKSDRGGLVDGCEIRVREHDTTQIVLYKEI